MVLVNVSDCTVSLLTNRILSPACCHALILDIAVKVVVVWKTNHSQMIVQLELCSNVKNGKIIVEVGLIKHGVHSDSGHILLL